MQIAVVIVNYRTPGLVLECLASIVGERDALPKLQAIVVDNASGDGSVEILSERLCQAPFCEWVTFLPLRQNGGFGWGNNQAILHLLASETPPDAFLLLNPDAMMEPGALVALVDAMTRHPDAGAIGSQLVNTDGNLSGSAFRFPTVCREFVRGIGIETVGRILGIQPVLTPLGERGPIDWATGASVLIRTQAFHDAGLFDTGFFLYFEEVELMHRFSERGWKTYHCPESRVLHIAGASTGVIDGRMKGRLAPPDYLFESRLRYFALTGGPVSAWMADIAWLVGDTCGRVIGIVAPRRSRIDTRAERKALLRIRRNVRTSKCTPAIVTTADRPGQPPAWIEAK